VRLGLLLAPLLFVQAVWFLAPGLLAGVVLLRRRMIAAHYVVPAAGLVGCLLGYAAFWIYFLNRTAGEAYTVITALAGLGAAAVIVFRRADRQLLRTLDVAGPLVLLYLVTLFYNGVTFACSVTPTVVDAGGPIDVNQYCHLNNFTGDNVLPQIFANNIVHGHPRATTWTFQGSDRPPLQAGVTFMQAPLTLLPGWRIAGYQLIATLLQALWVPALWALCRSLRLSGQRLVLVLTLCIFSGFFFFNSIFTWPKLLAAALLMIAFGIFFFEKELTPATAGIAGAAIGASMLAHAGVIFTLIPMGVALLLRRYRPNLKLAALAAAIVVVLLGPWQLYTSKYDPPGNRLLKWHLAGVIDVDNRTVGQALRDAYTQVPVTTILEYKGQNLTALVGWQRKPEYLYGHGHTSIVRDDEIRYVAYSLGIFNLGLLALLLRPIRRRLREAVDMSRLKLMLAVVGGSMLVWVALIYLPGNTVTFQGSYATMMLIFAALGAVISLFPRNVLRALVALQLAYFAVIWVGAVWRLDVLHRTSVGVSLVGVAALLACLELLRRRMPADPGEPVSAAPAAPGQGVPAVPVFAGVPSARSGDGVHDPDQGAEDRVPEQAEHRPVVDGEHRGAAP
jgi:hypothetical protein